MEDVSNTLIVDKRIKTIFTRYLITNLYNQLNNIIRNTTNFPKDEMLMVTLGSANEYSITIHTTSLKTNQTVNHTINYASMFNNQVKVLENPFISVDTDDSEYIGRYSLIDNELLLVGLNIKNKQGLDNNKSNKFQLKL